MKTWICIAGMLCLAPTLQAQERVAWRRDKVTQLIFPAEVVKFRAGYTSEDAMSQQDGRVMYIQPVDSMAETNLNVMTADGCYYTFTVVYDEAAEQVNFIVDPSAAIFREEIQATVEKDGAEEMADERQVEERPVERVFELVKKRPDYIVTDNMAKLQKLSFLLKGVYVDDAYVYFKFGIDNRSNVPFDVDYIAFSITARKTKKTSTQERLQILPDAVDTQVHRIDAKSRCEIIYRFEKFTIGREKILLAEVLEQGGDRNIALHIPEKFIIEARKL